ncbi:unnamed protein product [Pylaiella littoralis]
MSTLSHLQRWVTTSALNSPPLSHRIMRGTPNVRHNSTSLRATPIACLDGRGKPKGNFVALSITSSTHLLWESDSVSMASISIMSSSHGSACRPCIIGTRLLVDRFLLVHPQDDTYCLAS